MRVEISEITVGGDSNIEIFYFNGEKFTGIIYWQVNDFVGSEFQVKNGVKDGLEKEFLANGIISSEINYEEGQEEGIGKYFYESGKLKDRIYFEMGSIVWSETYDETGNLLERDEIDKNSFEYKSLQRHKEEREKNKL